MMTSMIGLTLATHPIQVLLAVVAIYYAGAQFLGSRRSGRNRPNRALRSNSSAISVRDAA